MKNYTDRLDQIWHVGERLHENLKEKIIDIFSEDFSPIPTVNYNGFYSKSAKDEYHDYLRTKASIMDELKKPDLDLETFYKTLAKLENSGSKEMDAKISYVLNKVKVGKLAQDITDALIEVAEENPGAFYRLTHLWGR